MFEFCNKRQSGWGRTILSVGAVVAVLLALPLQAFADGRFEIISAAARQVDGEWLVDGRVDLELSDQALEALQNGVALGISFQYEVGLRRRFWPDRQVAATTQAFELQYLSLSERYLVRQLDDDSQNSYATLFSALRYMGQVKDYAVAATPPDASAGAYYMAMRAVLDREQLPGPLQVFAFWQGDFSLESDWYRWKPN